MYAFSRLFLSNFLLIGLVILGAGCGHLQTKAPLDETQVAKEIQAEFESRWVELKPAKQFHFAGRMYRITGDKKYLYPHLVGALMYANNFGVAACHKDPMDLLGERNKPYMPPTRTRSREQIELLKKNPDFLRYSGILVALIKLKEIGLEPACYERFERLLTKESFKKMLVNDDLIKNWPAQAANHIYWAKQLNFTDQEQLLLEKLQKLFPASQDASLSESQYQTKLYGLTHVVLAKSKYYQMNIEPIEWISEYFHQEIDQIIRRSKEDVILEVGISLLLSGVEKTHPTIVKIRQHLLTKYDPKTRRIPSVNKKEDLNNDEHRNVLAIMFFTWPDKLFHSPQFSDWPELKEWLPTGLRLALKSK